MKIGLVLDDSLDRNDGVQQYVRTIGSWLTKNGHQVHYLAGQSEVRDKNIHSLARNITVRSNGNLLTIPMAATGRRISKLLKNENFDVLHVQMPYSPLLAGKVIKRAAKHTAVVGTFHILPYGKFQAAGNSILGRLQTRSLNRYDTTCAVSEAARRFARDTYRLSPTVIPNAIELAQWKHPASPRPGKIVFLGRLVPRKGCKELLLALGKLPPAERSNIELIIAGDGPERPTLQKLAKKLSLNAHFTGYARERDKPVLLGSADIAIFPSLGGESFGIVLIEAMAAGSGLVLGGDNPGYRNVLGEMPECLIDFSKPELAAAQLSKLLNNKNRRAVLHRAQQSAVKKYDVETVGRQIVAMYDTALLHRKQDVR